MTKPNRLVLVAIATAVAVEAISAQSSAPTDNRFEAASLKANRSGSTNLSFDIQPGGRVVATNVPLRTMVGNAFRVQTFQVVGAPDWYGTDRFDLVATAPGASRDEVLLMLQTLLADRFKLAVHHETRQAPIYALVMDRADGALGPNLSRSSVDCSTVPGDAAARSATGCGTRMTGGTLTAGGTTIPILVANLSPSAGRTIVDRTGLTGAFDVKLTFAPGGAGAATDDAPTLFTALREQLGLRLEATSGPMDVLVIDHVEKPQEN